MLKYKNGFEIDDVDLYILKYKKNGYKELIMSFKTIYFNTYTVWVIDLAVESKEKMTVYKHESSQLWESPASSFLLSENKEYVKLSKDGLSVMALGSIDRRPIKNFMIHSLESVFHLRVE
jgi:hypothetical protein